MTNTRTPVVGDTLIVDGHAYSIRSIHDHFALVARLPWGDDNRMIDLDTYTWNGEVWTP